MPLLHVVPGSSSSRGQGTWNVAEQTPCLWILCGGNIEVGDHPVTELSHPHREARALADQHHHLMYGPVQGMTTPLSDRRSMS